MNKIVFKIFLPVSITFLTIFLAIKSFSLDEKIFDTTRLADSRVQVSTNDFTDTTNKILYDVIDLYRIISLLEAPCSDFQISPLLTNLSIDFNRKFLYNCVNKNESIVNEFQNRFKAFSAERKYSILDFASEQLPTGYELIFSKDGFEYLRLDEIINVIKRISTIKYAQYLLVSSYVSNQTESTNVRVDNEQTFYFDLTKPPFNLTNYIKMYDYDVSANRYLLLYDMRDLKKANFTKMQINAQFYTRANTYDQATSPFTPH